MKIVPKLVDQLFPDDASEDWLVNAAPRHVDCAVDHVDRLDDTPQCRTQVQPCNNFIGRNKELTIDTGKGGWLLRSLGSTQNVGLLYMAFSAFNLGMMGMFVKLAGDVGMSTWEIVLARSVTIAVVCLLKLVCARTKPWGNRIVMLNLRGALGMLSVTCFYFAVRYLPVADAVVFTFLAPLIILVASPYVLGEDTGNQWLPIFLASVGVLLVCQPSFLFGHARLSLLGVMFGSIHATASAGAKMLVRALKEEHTAVKMLYLATYCVVVSLAAIAADETRWTLPSVQQAVLLLGCGITGLGMQLFLTMSLERVEASLGMGMTYTAIIWSELVGVTVFREIPDVWAIVGTAIVLYSTLHNSLVRVASSRAASPVRPESPWSDSDESVLLLKPQP